MQVERVESSVEGRERRPDDGAAAQAAVPAVPVATTRDDRTAGGAGTAHAASLGVAGALCGGRADPAIVRAASLRPRAGPVA